MSGASAIPGTNVPPVSFPGIASGIDYNSIISKLTSLSLSPTVSLNAQITTLNNANFELIKINGLLASVQTALTGLSQSELFQAIEAASGNTSALTAQGIPGVYATPGTYTIDATSLATPTVVTGAANVGHVITDTIPGTTASSADVPLADSFAAITPSNGSGTGNGSVTIDGVTVNYNVNTDSLNTILARINAAEAAAGDASFSISVSGNVAQITDGSQPVSLGAPSDAGNLLQVLRLDTAQVNNTATSGSVTGTGGVGGINQGHDFDAKNSTGAATDAGYLTPVTSGKFTINGVSISVDATGDNLASVIKRINASAAGVVASFNSATGQIALVSKTTGAQSIVLGSSSDTSNFLSATGLTTASGASTSIGKQASVTVETGAGPQTYYSNSNTIATAIPGVQLTLQGNTSTPFQLSVSQDKSKLVSAIGAFVSAYNAAINEINTATQPPVVATAPLGSGGKSTSVGGGVLYRNADVNSIKDELVNIVSGLNANSGTYNSLSTVGLKLTNSFTQIAQNTSGSNAGQFGTQTLDGTDGQLQSLDVNALQSALAADPNAVNDLINGSSGLVTQLGAYLTGVTGIPTDTESGLLGKIPSMSLLQGFENANTASVQSVQQQIKQIQDSVNMQADQLRQEFVASESQIAGLQALQSQLGSFFKSPS